jgi:chorismate mutase / prephenate dehydratase
LNTIKPINVAFLGPEGTFSHSAMLEIFGESVHPIAAKTIHDVFVETETGRADFGVAPIENSTEGGVTYTLDELLDTSLKVVGEKYLRISCSLLSAAEDAKKITRIYSHPQPIAQCKEWIRKNYPNAEVIQVSSTTIAAETASNDKSSAAIASEAAAGKYKLNILSGHIEDSKNNYTRFLIMGDKESPQTGKDKTSIICAVKDKSGALYTLLQPFNEQGINMTKIESRPDKKKMWAYNFFIDFIGHKDSKVVQNALEKMKEELVFLKILGSYPAEN